MFYMPQTSQERIIATMSSAPTSGSPIEELPTEIVEKIASGLEKKGLLAFASTSRMIRSQCSYTVGKRFFTTLGFCLRTESLQFLTNISNTENLARHVKRIIFRVDALASFDPTIDEQAMQRWAQHKGSNNPSWSGPIGLKEFRQAKYSSIIASAFEKLPRLLVILVGKDMNLNGRRTVRICGRFRIEQSTGSSKDIAAHTPTHFDDAISVFNTVCMALARLQNQDVILGLSLTAYDIEKLRMHSSIPPIWSTDAKVAKRIRYLDVDLRKYEDGMENLPSQLDQLVRDASIKRLSIKHWDPYWFLKDSRISSGWSCAAFDRLRRIGLAKWKGRSDDFASVFRSLKDQLTHVSLIDCSVDPYDYLIELEFDDSFVGYWIPALQELQQAPHLRFLQMQRLKSKSAIEHQANSLEKFVGMDLVLSAKWKCREEVMIGLEQLIEAHMTAGFQVGSDGKICSHYSCLHWRCEFRAFLDLQQANTKVGELC